MRGMRFSRTNDPDLPRTPNSGEVREELNRVLKSSSFRGSKRCQDFLQYIVTTVLEGDPEVLKERTLATEVFGRHATDDIGTDSIVRVGAREVRKRLAQYYVANGANDPVRVELPPGSYIPSFQYHTDLQAATTPALPRFPDSELAPGPERKFQISKHAVRIVGIIIAALCVCALLWQYVIRPADSFDVFWKPAFAQKSPIVLLIAHPIVYHPSSHAQNLDELRNGKPELPLQRPIDVPANLLDGSDYVPVTDQYVGFGDAEAAVRLAGLFFKRGGSVRLRMASKVEFNDLVGSGAVLVGAFTNRWTTELTKDFRFRLGYDNNRKPFLLDSSNGRKWTVSTKTDNGRSKDDYILICRLPHSKIDGFVVIGAGLTVYGTEEAGRILSDSKLLDTILRKLPSDWANRNQELILHVEVVGDAPALPELVARYAW
jgi:hypothetical protein